MVAFGGAIGYKDFGDPNLSQVVSFWNPRQYWVLQRSAAIELFEFSWQYSDRANSKD